jgi:hypothetical protein
MDVVSTGSPIGRAVIDAEMAQLAAQTEALKIANPDKTVFRISTSAQGELDGRYYAKMLAAAHQRGIPLDLCQLRVRVAGPWRILTLTAMWPTPKPADLDVVSG